MFIFVSPRYMFNKEHDILPNLPAKKQLGLHVYHDRNARPI
jgi:hypothetical protein